MKIYLKYFAMPLLIAVVASLLYVVDAFLGGLLVAEKSFLWVAFVSWTVFYSASLKDRVRGFIGIIIGFVSAIVMMLISSSFSLNLGPISISTLLGIFLVNGLVMYMNHGEKVWLNSLSGAFVGIFVTFSELGANLSPISSVTNCFLMFGILMIYSLLGLACGFISTYVQNKINKKISEIEDKNKIY